MRILVPLAFISFLIGCSVSGDGSGNGADTETGMGPYTQSAGGPSAMSANGPSASPATGPSASGSDGPSASPIIAASTEPEAGDDGLPGCIYDISDYIYLFSDLYNQYLSSGTQVVSNCNELKIMDGDQLVFQAILKEQKCEIDLKYLEGLILQKETKTIPDCPNVTQ